MSDPEREVLVILLRELELAGIGTHLRYRYGQLALAIAVAHGDAQMWIQFTSNHIVISVEQPERIARVSWDHPHPLAQATEQTRKLVHAVEEYVRYKDLQTRRKMEKRQRQETRRRRAKKAAEKKAKHSRKIQNQ